MGFLPDGSMFIAFLVIAAIFFVCTALAVMSRYKQCPPNKLLVVYGKVGKDKASRVFHGGATFVWPVFQSADFLDLNPMTIDIPLDNALSLQNIRVNVPSRFTIGISTEPAGMNNAAERLLGKPQEAIEELAKDIIYGQLRATIATMKIEEINGDREAFEKKVMESIETELKKIGLKFLNVNLKDISDESGFIEALGKKAAADATNKAAVQTAEAERVGAEGVANAEQQRRVAVAAANAEAITGENQSTANVADSEAELRERQAEAKRRGDVAEATKNAEAKTAALAADKQTQEMRAANEAARLHADEIVPAEVARKQKIIDAEAKREVEVLAGKARGEAKQAELAGEAAGQQAILEAQAEGFKTLVQAAGGNVEHAVQFLLVDKAADLAEIQAKAIENISFDKVVVMDGGTGGNAAANWMADMVSGMPKWHAMAEAAGVELPGYMGRANGHDTSGSALPASEASEVGDSDSSSGATHS